MFFGSLENGLDDLVGLDRARIKELSPASEGGLAQW
jgi:hypothetical protein